MSTQNWQVSNLCENGPTSFVFEGGPLHQSIYKKFSRFVKPSTYAFGNKAVGFVTLYRQPKKFRNSYCASCHSKAWLGCKVKRSFKILYEESEDVDILLRYHYDVAQFTFVYRLDFNKRTCKMDSDSILLYSDYQTGYDTCESISEQLKRCDCNSVLDIETGRCVELSYANKNCVESSYNRGTFELSSYALKTCGDNFTYVSKSEIDAEQLCEDCQNKENCDKVYSRVNSSQSYSSVHCAAKGLVGCSKLPDDAYCIESIDILPTNTRFKMASMGEKIPLLNAIAIKFEAGPPNIDGGFGQLVAAFSETSKKSCVEYTLVNTSVSNKWLVCENEEIYNIEQDVKYSDYLLYGGEFRVCTKYLEFQLSLHDYILSAFSFVFIIAYTIYYFVKGKKSTTQNFVVSSLVTLLGGLLCYCLIHTPKTLVGCRILTSLCQYLLLSVMCWTNAIGLWMIQCITSVKKTGGNADSTKTYWKYALHAWMTPLIFVIFAYLLNWGKIDASLYPVFSENLCFIAAGWPRILVFSGPIYIIIVVNTTLCIVATVKLLQLPDNKSSGLHKRHTRQRIIAVIKLQIIYGLYWLLLLFTDIKGPHQRGLWTVINILFTLQGVIVVLTQFLTFSNIEKIKERLSSISQSFSSTRPSKGHQPAGSKTSSTSGNSLKTYPETVELSSIKNEAGNL